MTCVVYAYHEMVWSWNQNVLNVVNVLMNSCLSVEIDWMNFFADFSFQMNGILILKNVRVCGFFHCEMNVMIVLSVSSVVSFCLYVSFVVNCVKIYSIGWKQKVFVLGFP